MPGAGNETRTRDPDLGKVVLYQLSYSRKEGHIVAARFGLSSKEIRGIYSSRVRLAQEACR